MSVFVVDASVAIKWVLPEIHSDAARRLLDLPHSWYAPDLLFAETANIVWKRVRRQELSGDEGQRLIDAIEQTAVESIPSRLLAADALAIAVAAGQSVYDSLYVALALRMDTRLITADERLWNAIVKMPPLSSHVDLLTTFVA